MCMFQTIKDPMVLRERYSSVRRAGSAVLWSQPQSFYSSPPKWLILRFKFTLQKVWDRAAVWSVNACDYPRWNVDNESWVRNSIVFWSKGGGSRIQMWLGQGHLWGVRHQHWLPHLVAQHPARVPVPCDGLPGDLHLCCRNTQCRSPRWCYLRLWMMGENTGGTFVLPKGCEVRNWGRFKKRGWHSGEKQQAKAQETWCESLVLLPIYSATSAYG